MKASLDLQRLTSPHEVACPWQRPKLEDLYDVEQFESPHLEDPHTAGVRMDVLVNDGRVLGVEFVEHKLYAWQPGSGQLAVEDDDLPEGGIVFAPYGQRTSTLASSDGSTLAVTVDHAGRQLPYLKQADGWSLLPGLPEDAWQLHAMNVSPNGEWVVGGQIAAVVGRSWIWGGTEGFAFLPPLQAADSQLLHTGAWLPLHVSADGQVLVGHGYVPGPFTASSIPAYTVRWNRREEPVLLRDGEGKLLDQARAASGDGRIVFGAGRERGNPLHPYWGNPWYWIEGGQHAWLGRDLDGEGMGEWRYCMPKDSSADGSVMVGVCSRNDGSHRERAFMWTSHTGLVSLPVDGDPDIFVDIPTWA